MEPDITITNNSGVTTQVNLKRKRKPFRTIKNFFKRILYKMGSTLSAMGLRVAMTGEAIKDHTRIIPEWDFVGKIEGYEPEPIFTSSGIAAAVEVVPGSDQIFTPVDNIDNSNKKIEKRRLRRKNSKKSTKSTKSKKKS